MPGPLLARLTRTAHRPLAQSRPGQLPDRPTSPRRVGERSDLPRHSARRESPCGFRQSFAVRSGSGGSSDPRCRPRSWPRTPRGDHRRLAACLGCAPLDGSLLKPACPLRVNLATVQDSRNPSTNCRRCAEAKHELPPRQASSSTAPPAAAPNARGCPVDPVATSATASGAWAATVWNTRPTKPAGVQLASAMRPSWAAPARALKPLADGGA